MHCALNNNIIISTLNGDCSKLTKIRLIFKIHNKYTVRKNLFSDFEVIQIRGITIIFFQNTFQ